MAKSHKYLYIIAIICSILWLSLFVDRVFLLHSPNMIIQLATNITYIPHLLTIFLTYKIYKNTSRDNKNIVFWFLIANIGLLFNEVSWYFVAYYNFDIIHISLVPFLINLIPFFIWNIAIIIFLAKILNRYILKIKHRINMLIMFGLINIVVILLFLSSIHYAAEIYSLSTISQISTFISQIIVFDFVILCLISTENTGLMLFLTGIIILISGDFFIVYSTISQTSKLYSYGTLLWLLGLLFNLLGVLIINRNNDYVIKNWVRNDNTIKSKLVFWCFSMAVISFLLFFIMAYTFSIISSTEFLGLPLFLMLYSIIIIVLSIYIGKYFETPFKQIAGNIRTLTLEENQRPQLVTKFSIEEFIFLQKFIIDAFIYKKDKEQEKLTRERKLAQNEVEHIRMEAALKQEQLKLDNEKNKAQVLELENQAFQSAAIEQEKFKKDVDQVLHDIRSPLTSLYVLAEYCTALPEKDRNDFRNIASTISDIANNLLNKYKTIPNNDHKDMSQTILVSVLLSQLLSEKKYQYKLAPVKFDYIIAKDSHFAFIKVQPSPIKRALSNLINNAVDALDNNSGIISINLEIINENVVITITDDGKGMPKEIINKIMNNEAITANKENGHGIGMRQVKQTLEQNSGIITIDSTVGIGTTIKLSFIETTAPSWIITKISINPDDTLIILDDDESIHSAWEAKLETIKTNNPSIKTQHFTDGNDFLNFISNSNPDAKQKFLLLSDYELLNQELNGLEIIEESKLTRTVLVTSHFDKLEIQAQAEIIGTKILPKQLVTDVLIAIINAK